MRGRKPAASGRQVWPHPERHRSEPDAAAHGNDVVKDGHVMQNAFTGDYSEAFDIGLRRRSRQSAGLAAAGRARARSVTDSAPAVEKDRMEHVTRHVEFMAHYAEAWIYAQALDEVLKRAVSLRKNKQKTEAKRWLRRGTADLAEARARGAAGDPALPRRGGHTQ